MVCCGGNPFLHFHQGGTVMRIKLFVYGLIFVVVVGFFYFWPVEGPGPAAVVASTPVSRSSSAIEGRLQKLERRVDDLRLNGSKHGERIWSLERDVGRLQLAVRKLGGGVEEGVVGPTVTLTPTWEPTATFTPRPPVVAPSTPTALELYDFNGNGRITCAEAEVAGIAPVPTTHPAYPYMRDGDGDGMVCE